VCLTDDDATMAVMPTSTPASHVEPDPDHHHDHEGLAVDLPHFVSFLRPVRRIGRRTLLLNVIGGAGVLAVLAACSSNGSSSAATASTAGSNAGTVPATSATAATTATTATTAVPATAAATSADPGAPIPEETAGPYPGDGTNGPNALSEQGIVRPDIRTSVGSAGGTAEGIETTIALRVVDAATGAPLPGAAVYLWHCTQDGAYSMYDIPSENYLRGVQVADGDGNLAFTTVFPGCYSGRWPHAHFEVYESLDDATNGRQAVVTSQLAFPEAACAEAYTAAGYEASVHNLARNSLSTDMVFSDGADDQLVTVTGTQANGYTASLVVRV
jgi:protocatechuate 3,4-dioxygenase beta subunit